MEAPEPKRTSPEVTRVTVELDQWELAAVLNFYTTALARLGTAAAEAPMMVDDFDIDCATRYAKRVQELYALAREF